MGSLQRQVVFFSRWVVPGVSFLQFLFSFSAPMFFSRTCKSFTFGSANHTSVLPKNILYDRHFIFAGLNVRNFTVLGNSWALNFCQIWKVEVKFTKIWFYKACSVRAHRSRSKSSPIPDSDRLWIQSFFFLGEFKTSPSFLIGMYDLNRPIQYTILGLRMTLGSLWHHLGTL